MCDPLHVLILTSILHSLIFEMETLISSQDPDHGSLDCKVCRSYRRDPFDASDFDFDWNVISHAAEKMDAHCAIY